MENLATESFSYSWLTHQQPPPSDNLRRRTDDDDDFHFDVAPSSPAHHLVNADEIFSKGQIMAVYADTRPSTAGRAASVPSSPLSVPFLAAGSRGRRRYYIIGKWRRSSKKMLLKLLGFVGCSCSFSCSRKSSSRVHHDIERKVRFDSSPARQSYDYSELGFGDGYCLKIDKNWRSNVVDHINISPSPSTSYVCCDAGDENSIREAILYCKRSILAPLEK